MEGGQGPGTDNDQISKSLIVDLAHVLRYILCGMYDEIGPKSLCRFQTITAYIRSDDSSGSRGLGHGYVQKTGNTAAQRKDRLAGIQSSKTLSPDDTCQGFDERSILE
jgi:hypothetical protein